MAKAHMLPSKPFLPNCFINFKFIYAHTALMGWIPERIPEFYRKCHSEDLK